MRRNLFFGMFVAASVLLATSCSSDDLATTQSGNEAQVTFALNLENGIGTRSISDGKSVDELVYAVFDADGNRISDIKQVRKTAVTFPATETLTLAKGRTYKVAFWAQDNDCKAYSVDDKMNVTVSYDNAKNNDETRDAFFKTETFTVTGSTEINVKLKRPFAQINVGVEQSDWNAAVAAGADITQSSVEISRAATTLNLVTGKTGEPKDVTYSLANIPSEELNVDVNGDGGIGKDETYKWLSMGYILVNDDSETGTDKAALDGLKFTFKPETGNNVVLENGLDNVPVQRNWRTNILGKLLTGDVKFNISIDPIYEGDYNHTAIVSTTEQLTDAIADPEITTVILNNDLNNVGPVNLTTTKEIDLNSKTLQVSAINVKAPLAIKNGNLTSSNYVLQSYAGANIELENVNVTTTQAGVNAINLGWINPTNNKEFNCGNAQLTLKNTVITTAKNGAGILIHGANNKVKLENTKIKHNWFGITQNGIIPGSEIELINCDISGPYSGIYLSNNAKGAKNTLKVTGGKIHSEQESAIEVKKTDITVNNVTLSSDAKKQKYTFNGGGSGGEGYGIVLAAYNQKTAYEGETSFENITYKLAAEGDNVIKILKWNGNEGEKVE